MDDEIRVIPFESSYQEAVATLFRAGLVNSYRHKSNTVRACQENFVNLKLSIEGDMHDIAASFMSYAVDSCHHFWIALDASNNVVGHVGLVPSTYPIDEDRVYEENRGLTPDTVGELVRMSVHTAFRGRGLGKKLVNALERFAVKKGLRRIVLSTLAEMEPAVALYKKCGYRHIMETSVDTKKFLGPGEWEDPITIVHFVKDFL